MDAYYQLEQSTLFLCNLFILVLLISLNVSILIIRVRTSSFWRNDPTEETQVAHVVTDSCIRCRYTDCVDVCPVDCFHAGPNFLVIDPDECIDCAVCIPECPVDAIRAEDDVPADQSAFIGINAELARVFPAITAREAPLPDAERWAQVKGKLEHLQR